MGWPCSVCTFVNVNDSASRCAICASRRARISAVAASIAMNEQPQRLQASERRRPPLSGGGSTSRRCGSACSASSTVASSSSSSGSSAAATTPKVASTSAPSAFRKAAAKWAQEGSGRRYRGTAAGRAPPQPPPRPAAQAAAAPALQPSTSKRRAGSRPAMRVRRRAAAAEADTRVDIAVELEWDPTLEWWRDDVDGCVIECRAPCAADAMDFDYVVEPGRRRGEERTVWDIESAVLPAALATALPACAADGAAVRDALTARRARVTEAVRLDALRIDAEASALEATALAQATERRNRGRVRASSFVAAAAGEGGELLAIDPNETLEYEPGDDVDKCYVECSACLQWRELPSFADPSALAETWMCSDARVWIERTAVAACETPQDVYRAHVLRATVAVEAVKAAFLAVAAAATYTCVAEGEGERLGNEWRRALAAAESGPRVDGEAAQHAREIGAPARSTGKRAASGTKRGRSGRSKRKAPILASAKRAKRQSKLAPSPPPIAKPASRRRAKDQLQRPSCGDPSGRKPTRAEGSAGRARPKPDVATTATTPVLEATLKPTLKQQHGPPPKPQRQRTRTYDDHAQRWPFDSAAAPPPPPQSLPPQSHAFSAHAHTPVWPKQPPRRRPRQNQAVDVGAADRFERNALGNTPRSLPPPPAASLDAAAAGATAGSSVLPGFLQTRAKLQVSRVVDHVLSLNSSNLEPRMTVRYLSAIVHDVLDELHVCGSEVDLEKHSKSIAQSTLGVLRRISIP